MLVLVVTLALEFQDHKETKESKALMAAKEKPVLLASQVAKELQVT